jgi:hypothetical protein
LIDIDAVVTDIGATLTAEQPDQKMANDIAEVNKKLLRLNEELYSLKNG